MNDLFQLLVNIALVIGAVWAAAKTFLMIWDKWQAVENYPKSSEDDLKEVHRQLTALWGKLVELEASTDARLNQIERKLSYLAGVARCSIENLPDRGELND